MLVVLFVVVCCLLLSSLLLVVGAAVRCWLLFVVSDVCGCLLLCAVLVAVCVQRVV